MGIRFICFVDIVKYNFIIFVVVYRFYYQLLGIRYFIELLIFWVECCYIWYDYEDTSMF